MEKLNIVLVQTNVRTDKWMEPISISLANFVGVRDKKKLEKAQFMYFCFLIVIPHETDVVFISVLI